MLGVGETCIGLFVVIGAWVELREIATGSFVVVDGGVVVAFVVVASVCVVAALLEVVDKGVAVVLVVVDVVVVGLLVVVVGLLVVVVGLLVVVVGLLLVVGCSVVDVVDVDETGASAKLALLLAISFWMRMILSNRSRCSAGLWPSLDWMICWFWVASMTTVRVCSPTLESVNFSPDFSDTLAMFSWFWSTWLAFGAMTGLDASAAPLSPTLTAVFLLDCCCSCLSTGLLLALTGSGVSSSCCKSSTWRTEFAPNFLLAVADLAGGGTLLGRVSAGASLEVKFCRPPESLGALSCASWPTLIAGDSVVVVVEDVCLL